MTYSIRPHLTPFFAEIEATKLIRHALDIATMTVDRSMHYEPSPVLVVGKPGNGKSTALLKLELEQNNIVYVQASSSQTNLNGLLESLLAALKIHHGRKHLRDMMELVMDNLEMYSLIVLVDEYQTFNLNAIRELMRMCESSLTPLVLVGNKERLKATGSEKTALDQINSRIFQTIEIGNPSSKDCITIGVKYNVEGKDAYDRLVEFGQAHSLRLLTRMLNTCRLMVSEGSGIQKHHICEAIKALPQVMN